MTSAPRTTRRTASAWVLFGCLLVSAPAATQELPEKYRKWLEEEVVYIISPRERDAFLELQSVEEREAFIAAFWRRRDPDLLTPVNEFQEEHYRRIAFANRELGRESAVPGWMTDRGKMYILLGQPRDRETFMAVPGLYPIELWFYAQDREKALPPLYLLFFQDNFAGPYRLFNHLLDEPADLMPAQPLDPNNARREAYDFLQTINPALAHASITMRADQAPFAGLLEPARSSLDFQVLLADIYVSPYRRLDTRWADAASDARGLVESDYLFNYVPSLGMANVLPGPGGTSFLHYTIEIEPQYMTLAREDRGVVYYTSLEARGELLTGDGELVYQFSKELPVQLTESQFRDVMARPFAYRDMIPVAEGEYTFRLILKNRARSEYTLFEVPVRVDPAPGERPFLGEPVLLYGLDELDNPETAGLYRTYQLGSIVLNPNAKRAYAIGETLMAYIPTMNLSPDQRVVLEVVNREGPDTPLSSKTVTDASTRSPLIETLGLDEAVGARYELIAKLLDGGGDILARATAPFDVTPRVAVSRPWVLRESVDGENEAVVKATLAEQYLVTGNYERAKALCEQSVALDPNLLAPRLILGRMRLDAGDALGAIRLLEPARAQHPENAEVLTALGDAYFETQNFARAAELLEAALPLRRATPTLLNALGVAKAQLGLRQSAIDYFTRSLELDPDQPKVRTALEELRAPTEP